MGASHLFKGKIVFEFKNKTINLIEIGTWFDIHIKNWFFMSDLTSKVKVKILEKHRPNL